MKNVVASVVICEKVLNEIDSVTSAIRIADMFSLKLVPGVPQEQHIVPIAALVSIRVLEHDDLEHSAEVKLIRPNGEEAILGDTIKTKIQEKVPGVPGGLNFVLQVGVKPLNLGCTNL